MNTLIGLTFKDEGLRHDCSDPILAPAYDLIDLINLVEELSFLGEGDANPYSHLRKFLEICDLRRIKGVTDNTICWKLFLHSLMGKAKQWYNLTRDRVNGEWETLTSKFCKRFFPIYKEVHLQKDIMNFEQHKDEPLKDSWDRFYDLTITSPDLGMSKTTLIRAFYFGLRSENDKENLNASSGGSFLSLSPATADIILDRICGYSTGPFPKELEESSSNQEEESMIANLKPFQSQDLDIHPEPSISQNPPREEEIPPSEESFKFEGNPNDFGKEIYSHPHKRPPSDHIENSLKEESRRKRPCSYKAHWEELKDGTEGEKSHLEDNLIFSSSKPRQVTHLNPSLNPSLILMNPHLFLEIHDPRTPLEHLNHRSHEDHEEEHNWMQQCLEQLRSTFTIVKDKDEA